MTEAPTNAIREEHIPRREAVTMALYVAIVLLAEAVALQASSLGETEVIVGAVWGTTIGVTLAHVYAFTLSTSLFSQGRIGRTDRLAAVAQLAAAGVVALVATLPFLFLSTNAAFNLSGSLLTVLIGATGYGSARAGGVPLRRAILIGAVALAAGAIVVSVKAALSH